MTNEQIEQAVRDVVGPDASERKVQALVRAVKRFGPEWLKTYQQRQQRQSATGRQYTSRQRITLDWDDVEAWVMRQPQTSENWAVGGYYTTCPVPTHKTDDLISVWSGKDGGLGLKCWGNCTYNDIHKEIADAIKIGAPSVTEPPAAADARIKELEQKLDAAEAERDREHDARIAAKNDVRKLQQEKDDLRGGTVRARLKERDANKGRIEELEQKLDAAEAERDRERDARIAADNKVQKLEAGNSNQAEKPADLSKARQESSLQRQAPEHVFKVIPTAEHHHLLLRSIEESSSELTLVSPWISKEAFDDDVRQKLADAVSRGTKVRIAWGIGGNRGDSEEDRKTKVGEESLKDLKQRISRKHRGNLVVKHPANTHEKFIICDNKFCASGSFNWLSYRGELGSGYRREASFYSERPEDIACWKENASYLFEDD